MKFLIVTLLLTVLTSKISNAQSTDLIINEIQIEPIQQVEILNTGINEIDISSFYIDDDSGSTYFTIPQNSVIGAGKCLVFTGNFNFNRTSADTVRLFSSSAPPPTQGAVLIDSYNYSKSPGEFISFQRPANEADKWITAEQTMGFFNITDQAISCLPEIPTPQPTPTFIPTVAPTTITSSAEQKLNSIGTVTSQFNQDFSKIKISEIMPNPASNEREWIEVYNSSDLPTDLDLWFLDDKENSGSTPRQISGIVNPKDFLIIYIDPPMLNNTQDDVILIDKNLNKIDQVSYQSTLKNFSYAKDSANSDLWCFQAPTPKKNNNECFFENTPQNNVTQTLESVYQPEASNQSELPFEKNIKHEYGKVSYFSQISMTPQKNIIKTKADVFLISQNHNSFLSGKNNLIYASLLSGVTFAGIIAKMWNEFKKNTS